MKTIAAALVMLMLAGIAWADPPATQPSNFAAERAAKLKADLKTFTLSLDYNGEQDKPYYHLLLSVPELMKIDAIPFHERARITEDEAKAIIDHLAIEGFLDNPIEGGDLMRASPDPNYMLAVRVENNGDPVQYRERLGLNLKTLQRFEGLRKVLEGDAAKDMDLLLGRMAGHRKEWEGQAPAASQPAAKPLTKDEIVAKCRDWVALYSAVGLKDAPRKQFSTEDIRRQPLVSHEDGLWRVEFANSKGGYVVIWLDAAGTQTKVEHTGPTLINKGPPQTQPDVAKLITDLSSDDGPTRVAATKAIFALGKDGLEPLAKAGAKQVSPFGTIGSSRIDVVFSLLDGLKPNPVPARAGYRADGFGLRVEKGCTQEDVAKMGEKYGFVISGTFRADTTPSCYVKLKPGKDLGGVLKAVLSEEPKVIAVNLNYFET